MNPLQQTIYNRFARYIAVETTSDPTSNVTPTTSSQISFAHKLADEMRKIGFSEVEVDEYGFVTGLIPANTDKKAPTIGLFAHMDTVCDYNGANIRPVIHENYDGGTLTINADKKMFLSPETAPNLKLCKGDTIITADGNSLLGGDDKMGIAVIMSLGEYLLQHPEIKHGPVKAAFTIDEETGTGIAYFDVKKFAADFAYTIDGATLGDIDCGNFNADTVTINITGKSCHPGSAKGFMANPVRIAADIISSWPEDKLPETTDGEDGFVLFKDITGALNTACVQGIVREHDLAKFEQFKKDLCALVEEKRKKYDNNIYILDTDGNVKDTVTLNGTDDTAGGNIPGEFYGGDDRCLLIVFSKYGIKGLELSEEKTALRTELIEEGRKNKNALTLLPT